MVSAADLQRQHGGNSEIKNSTTNGNSIANGIGNANGNPIMNDPFPALSEDPFPPQISTAMQYPPIGNKKQPATENNLNGNPPSATQFKKPGVPQPDFDSESAFPSLGAASPAPKGQWGKKLSVKASSAAAAPSTASWAGTAPVIQRATFQEIFSLPSTDHTDAARFSQAMQRVLEKNKGKVKIDASTTTSATAGKSTTFVIRAGDQKKVNDAKRELQVLLAKNVSPRCRERGLEVAGVPEGLKELEGGELSFCQEEVIFLSSSPIANRLPLYPATLSLSIPKVTLTLMMPASLRGFVVGPKGKNLKNITDQTKVKIDIPRAEPGAIENTGNKDDYSNDEQVPITISGDEISAHQAQKMLTSLISERTSRSTVRLTEINHVWYPFLSGAKGKTAREIEALAAGVAPPAEGEDAKETDVSVRIPPRAALLPPKEREREEGLEEGQGQEQQRERDLAIVVTGERELVAKAVKEIENRVNEMTRTYRTLQISISKRQHRFLVGDNAANILGTTGCIIELAPIDDPSDSVTIRGPPAQLPVALTAAMECANAIQVEVLDLLSSGRFAGVSSPEEALDHAKLLLRWLSAHSGGGISTKMPRSQGTQVFLPRASAIENEGTVQIDIVGPAAEQVSKTRATIDGHAKRIRSSYMLEMDIDPLVHRFVIGKNRSGLTAYESKGIEVIFPPNEGESRSDVLLVLSSEDAIKSLPPLGKGAAVAAHDAKAQEILRGVSEELKKKEGEQADIREEKINVPAKLHRSIIGPGGTTLNAVIGEERLVIVRLGSSQGGPSAGKAATAISENEILIRGPSDEVTRIVTELRRIASDAESDAIINGHIEEFEIDSSHVPHLVGRGGAAVTKLREELGVRVDFGDNPAAEADAKTTKKSSKKEKVKVTLTGRKENVLEAKKRLEGQAEKLADETTIVVKVPPKMHAGIIGQGGKYVIRLQETYVVRIDFPKSGGAAEEDGSKPTRNADQKADEVIIRGGKKGVAGAKAELLELLEYENEHNNVELVPVSSKSVARIMGKAGATVNQIRDDTGAKIDVDREGDSAITNIKLVGTKNAISEAKAAILAISKEVDAEETYTLKIPSEFHGQLIGPGGQAIRDLITRAGGPDDSKAASQMVLFPRKRGDASDDAVVVRGPAAIASKIKEELESIAAALAARICLGVIVAPPAQRMLVGRGGSRQSELQAKHSVRIIMPGWKEYDGTPAPVNASELATAGGTEATIVKIQGDKSACEALAQEIATDFASAERKVKISKAAHIKLATPQFFRQLRSDFGVSVDTPRGIAASQPKVDASSSVAASAARIDADEDESRELAFELVELSSGSSEGEEQIEWTLTGKDEKSLDAAEAKINRSSSSSDFTHEGRLSLPPGAAPRIIGRGGSGLAAIQSETGASIDIPRGGASICYIRGDKDSVLDARERIQRIALTPSRRD